MSRDGRTDAGAEPRNEGRPNAPEPPLLRRLAWFAVLWAAGVGVIYLVAAVIRLALGR